MGNKSIKNVNILYNDLNLFWKAYEKSYPTFKPHIFEELYFSKASPPVKSMYIPFFIQNVNNLTNTLKRNVNYFNVLKKKQKITQSIEDKINESFNLLLKLYPKTIFPDIFFVIGNFSTAGAFMNDFLFISLEMFPDEKQVADGVETFSFEDLIVVIMHEIIHLQQNFAQDKSLLAACIKEGSADFITELVLGINPSKTIYEKVTRKEKLLKKFKSEMHSLKYHNWLYSCDINQERDQGYWIGYEITKSYFNNVTNKTKALNEILNITDFHKFLLDSKFY